MIRKLNRIFQDYMREKRLKIVKGNNFIKDNNIKSILFLRYDGKIGDMVVNSLMFREIKKVYPNIKIGVVARGAAIDIIKDNPNIDKIYEYHKDRKKIKNLALKIKEEKYDLLIDFSEMLRVNQMMLINLCGARINIGIEKDSWNLFDISLNDRDFDKHISEMYIKILKFLGINNINSSYDVFSSDYLLKKLDLKGANLVVSPDTSIVHLARAFDKKMICIYRKELGKEDKNSILWGPNSEKAKVIFVEEKVKDGEEIDINHINLDEFKKEMERV